MRFRLPNQLRSSAHFNFILEHLIENPRPSPAEDSLLANSVYPGKDDEEAFLITPR